MYTFRDGSFGSFFLKKKQTSREFFFSGANCEFISSSLRLCMGKAQGADKEQRLGQVKAKLTTGQGFQSRRAGGEQRGKGHRRGFAQPLHPVQQILVMIKAHHKSRAKSYLCYLLLLWDLVSEPQFTNLQNGSHNKLLDDTRRGLP